ncbi:MAG: hypothetical protein WCX79_01260 [Candidatus Paceibacterota bacterium]|jgi:hypothetical protein
MLIDTSKCTTPILVIAILLLAASVAYAGYNYGHVNTTTTPIVVTVTPTPTPEPTSYLTNVVTVDSMTTSGGFCQINIREDDRTFNVPYSYYDELNVGDRVQFHVVSTYTPFSSIVYKTDYVNIISHYWSNTRYYYYNDRYYRDDNRVTVEVTWDEAHRHEWVNGKPSHYWD